MLGAHPRDQRCLIHQSDPLRPLGLGTLDLYDSYRQTAEANGVDPNEPVLGPCRGDNMAWLPRAAS